MDKKLQLISDIQTLLNGYDNVNNTSIDPAILEFMDEETLKNIIGSLLDQKEESKKSDTEWLEQFKSEK
ncbi:hypothetical protein GJV85_06655 [Sulfurimonas aquatica]|uniref:Uncharacterized protein n=1 Tax=Sulfurimonas aquatica TaxID=2672570 RepID=A0A975B0B7_9BACT|nr:hypothetical protein [Sulfurimonas aquatica]QSZ41800.1 hypothetical protein GJV85_06655 [Sulfurimonas aquatica]